MDLVLLPDLVYPNLNDKNYMLAQNFEEIQADAFKGNAIPKDVGSLISRILPYIFSAAAMALLIYLVMGGLQMMTSKGDPKAMQSAQAKITNAIIGFVIVIFAFVIVQLLGQILGLSAFSQLFN